MIAADAPVPRSRRRKTVIIAEDFKLLADACRCLLQPEYEVVGMAKDGYELLELATSLRPDGVICDIAMPRLNGLDAAEQLRKLLPETKLVFWSVTESPFAVSEALRLGAAGFVLKCSASRELRSALRAAFRGEFYASPSLVRNGTEMGNRYINAKPWSEQLSFRQRSVFQLLVDGASLKEIASALNIEFGTAAFHKYEIMRRLGARTTSDLVRIAVQLGIA